MRIILVALLIFPLVTYAYEYVNDNMSSAYDLVENDLYLEQLDSSKLSEAEKTDNFETTVIGVLFQLEKCPSWIDVVRDEYDIRHSIMRIYTWIAQYKTITIREGIKRYLFNSPYEVNIKYIDIDNNIYIHPEFHKIIKVYGLLRIIFNIPESYEYDDDFSSRNIRYIPIHTLVSLASVLETNKKSAALWPFEMNNEKQLIFTGDYGYSPMQNFNKNPVYRNMMKEKVLESFDSLNEKFGRRKIKPLNAP